jgi:small-conductance mechanosensitive channel
VNSKQQTEANDKQTNQQWTKLYWWITINLLFPLLPALAGLLSVFTSIRNSQGKYSSLLSTSDLFLICLAILAGTLYDYFSANVRDGLAATRKHLNFVKLIHACTIMGVLPLTLILALFSYSVYLDENIHSIGYDPAILVGLSLYSTFGISFTCIVWRLIIIIGEGSLKTESL